MSTQKTFGIPNTITIEGKVYKVGIPNRHTRGRFEAWCKSKAWSEVESTRGTITEESYRRRYDEITAKICTGYCSAGGEGFERMAQTAEGQAYHVYLLLSLHHPEITPEQVQDWYDGDYEQALLARMKEAMHDPNPPSPLTATGSP